MAGIAFVAERALPARGGLARATSRIAAHAAALGEPAHLICLSREAPPGGRGRSERDGVILHPVGHLARPDDSRMALFTHALDVVREHALDVVHGMYATWPGHTAVRVAQVAGAASVVAIRGNDLDRGLHRAADLPALTAACEQTTVLTAVSRDHAERAERIFRRPCRWVTNSVDAERFVPADPDNTLRAAVGLDEHPVIGFSGELREKKGLRFLLPAFAALRKRRECSLLLIGGLRAEAEEAWQAFEKAAPEAAARVAQVPWSSSPAHLSRMLSLCDVMVFPSLIEGTPNAVLEAMACERCVLATDVGGHPDLITHGHSGALLDLGDLDRLPEALGELLAMDDVERRRLGKAAREYVLAHHRPEQEREVWADVWAAARAAAG
jgi:glycosyltransferase involved in cell wall biosynthesis